MKYLFIIAFLITGMVVHAQKEIVPVDVQNAFEQKYPNAEDVKCKEKKELYRIKFKVNDHHKLAVFTSAGEWVKTETTLGKTEIPKSVSDGISKKYPKGIYNNGVLCEEASGNNFYKVAVDTPGVIYKLEVDNTGNILKTEKVEKPKESSPPVRSSGSARGNSDGGDD